MATEFNWRVVGVDPSEKMLLKARLKPSGRDIGYVRGSGEALPLRGESADLVFMSMAYHHFANSAAVATECRRVLRRGGCVCLRNSTRESDFPHRRFFPALAPLILSDLPSRSGIQATFEEIGFRLIVSEKVKQTVAPNWAVFVEKSALRVDSFLARLSDDDFLHGMTAMQELNAIWRADDPVTEEVDWFVFQRGEPPVAGA